MVLLSGKNPSLIQSLQQVIDVNDDLSGNNPLSGQVIQYDGTNVVWVDLSSSIIPTLQQVLTQGNTASTNIIINGTHTTTMTNNGISIDGQTTYSNIGANIKGLIKIESNPNTTISLSGSKGATGNVLVSGGPFGNLSWAPIGGLQSLQSVIDVNDDLNGNTPGSGQVIQYDGTNVVWGDVSTPTLQSVLDAGNIANQTITLENLTKTTSISDSAISISNIISSSDNTSLNLSDTLISLSNNTSTAGAGSIQIQTTAGSINSIGASSEDPTQDIFSSISMNAAPLNPDFRLSQTDDNFGESYSLVILKDSITHNCSGVTGPFTISTNTDLTLTSTQNINLDTPTGQVFINGTAYPPATPPLSSVLTAGSTSNAGQTITLTSSSVVGQTVYGSEQLTQTGAIPYSMNTQGDLLITAPNFQTTNSTIIIPNSGVSNHTFLDGSGTHVITNGASQADLYSGSLEIKDLPTTTESFIAARSSTTLNNFHNQTTNASTPTSVIITDGILNKTGIFSNNILQFQDNTISGNVGTFGVNSVQGSFNDNDITTSYQLFSQNYAELGIDTNNNTLNKRGSVLLSTNVTNSQYPILDMTNYSSVTPSTYQRVQLSPSKLYSFSNVPAPNIPDFTIQSGGTLKINPGTTLDVVTGTYSTQTSTQINFNSTSGDVNNTGINYNITGTSPFSKLTITNSNYTVGNTAGIASTEYYKSGRNGATGDTIASQRFYAKNYNGDRTEFANMEVNIKNTSSSNDDGSIIFRARSNGTMTDYITVNGDENHINMFKPLDMNSNNIRSSTGSMTITTVFSTGLGNITAIAKGDVAISSGTNGSVSLTSGGAGGAVNLTGLAVNITSNGTGEKTTLTSATTINLVPDATTGAILTDSKIATLQGFPNNVGCSVDFFQGNPDDRFTLNKNNLLFNQYYTSPVDKINIIDIKNDANTGDNYINQKQTNNLTGTGVQTQNICNLTTQKFIINDNRTTENKSITLDNNPNSNENRIDLQKTDNLTGSGTGMINQLNTQQLYLTKTNNNVITNSLSLNNSSNGSLIYTNTIDTNILQIASTNTNLQIQTSSTISGQGNIIIAPSQNGSANGQLVFTGASLQSSSSGANSGQYLSIILNGTAYKIRLEHD